MSRVLALVLAASALASPWTARAQGRADVRLPAGEFLQRDPEGYADSVNVYAAMANDPVNNRDPTGKLVVSSKFRRAHPRTAALIDGLHQRARRDPRLVSLLAKWGGVTRKWVFDALRPGLGPVVDEEPNAGLSKCGRVIRDSAFTSRCKKATGYVSELHISDHLVEHYESGLYGDLQMEQAIFHELVHLAFFDQHKDEEPYGDHGDRFTSEYYNGVPDGTAPLHCSVWAGQCPPDEPPLNVKLCVDVRGDGARTCEDLNPQPTNPWSGEY